MSEKFCPQCGAKADAVAKFCPECGTPLGQGVAKPSQKGKPTTSKSRNSRDLLIVVGVLAVVAIAYFMLVDQPTPPIPPTQQQMGQPGEGQSGQGMTDPHAEGGISMAMLDSLPNDYATLVQTAYHYHDEGSRTNDAQNFALAAELYRRALAIDASDPNIRVDYGAVLHGMGLPQRALEEFGVVLKTNPRHPIANFNIGIVHHDIGNADSAKIYFKRYLEIEPNGPASQNARDFLKELGG